MPKWTIKLKRRRMSQSLPRQKRKKTLMTTMFASVMERTRAARQNLAERWLRRLRPLRKASQLYTDK